jgi:hypothetical protein
VVECGRESIGDETIRDGGIAWPWGELDVEARKGDIDRVEVVCSLRGKELQLAVNRSYY